MSMRTYISMLLFILFTSASAQNNTDSISKEQTLQEVVVLAPNMTRMDNYILVRPDNDQRKHSGNALELLQNSFISGVVVNLQDGIVEAMGARATLYLNGQPCEIHDLLMLRPRDIEKIEYHDIPAGKYSNDRTAINFVVKQYRYGGYVLAKAQQTVGYDRGIYDVAATLNHGRNTFSVFAGANYTSISNNESNSSETFSFDTPLSRYQDQTSAFKHNSQYLMLRYQNNGKKNYLVAKLSLINSDNPSNNISGISQVNGENISYLTESSQSSLSPKFDLNGEYRFNQMKSINYGLHFAYNRNKYHRNYTEEDYRSKVDEKEDAYSFSASLIYNTTLAKGAFTAELYHFHNIWDSHYSSDTDLSQDLWKGESLAFLSYNRRLSKSLSLTTRVGLDWLQHHLDGTDKFSQITPRVNLNLQYQIPRGSLLYSVNYVNSNYGSDILNDVEVNIDRYMSVKGNPNLNKSYDFMTYIYYMQQFKNKLTVSAVSQYNYSHNYVTTYYTRVSNRIVRSFSNDGDTHFFSEIIGLSYRFSPKVSVGGDIRYTYSKLSGREDMHTDKLTGNINAAYYWRDFSIQPTVSFAQRSLDFATMTISEIPIDYSLRLSYSKKNLYLSANVRSPFNRRRTKTTMNSMAYSQFCEILNRSQSRYCDIAITYTFDFGRKTKVINEEINRDNNSSLLKVSR